MFCCAVLCVLSSFAIIPMGKRELVALLCLSPWCLVTVSVLCLFNTMLWLGLQCVIVVFPDHTHLLFRSVVRDCVFTCSMSFVKIEFEPRHAISNKVAF